MEWKELLKGPVNIISIILGLWLATTILEQDIKKIGLDGIELQEVKDRVNLTSQELFQIKDSIKRISSLEKELQKTKHSKKTLEEKMRDKKILDFINNTPLIETQIVSNKDIALAIPIGTKNKTYLKGKIGFMWIGNYNRSWDSPRLRTLDGNIIQVSPQDIQIHSKYKVIGNIYLRETKPKYNQDYYRHIKSLGIILNNTIITILNKPILYNRHKKQYWVKVKVEE